IGARRRGGRLGGKARSRRGGGAIGPEHGGGAGRRRVAPWRDGPGGRRVVGPWIRSRRRDDRRSGGGVAVAVRIGNEPAPCTRGDAHRVVAAVTRGDHAVAGDDGVAAVLTAHVDDDAGARRVGATGPRDDVAAAVRGDHAGRRGG